jgi:uncharacterized membrane protein
MSQCQRCGASLPDGASYCLRCGAAVSQAGGEEMKATALPATTGVLWPEAGARITASSDPSGAELPIPENVAGVVAYITIIPAIVFLSLEPFKRNIFVRFHAFQHLFLWGAGLAVAVAAGILTAILQWIPFMRVLVFPLAGLISLAWFFLWLLLLVKAYHHQMFKLPIIGDLAEQQAGV